MAKETTHIGGVRQSTLDQGESPDIVLDRVAGFGLFDSRLELTDWTDSFVEQLDYPATIIERGASLLEFFRCHARRGDFGPGDAEELARAQLDAVARRAPRTSRIETPGGRILRLSCDPLRHGVLLAGIDVTDQRDTLHALRENEKRYTLLAEAVEEGVYDWYVDRDEIYVSPRLQRFFKFDVDELGPKEWNWNSRIHPDDLQHYLDTLEAHFARKTPRWRCEYRFRDKAGDYRWILDHGYTIRNEEGGAIRLVGAIRDIDQRKTTEKALRESEARYELAIRAINEGVYDWDIDNDSVFYSDRVYEVLELDRRDLRASGDWLERIHPEDVEGYKAALVEHFKGESDRFEHAFRYRDRAGNWRWALQHGIALRTGRGRAYRMIGSTGDITALKEKDRQLAEKSVLLETTLENIDQGITLVDRELRTLALNSKFLELLGLPPEKFKSGFHMEDAFRFNAERGEYGPGDIDEQVRERVELARKFEPHVFERVRPDGSVIAIRGKPLPEGGFVSTYTDVTEQRRVEAALRENEERYALASQAATEGIYDWDVETGSLFLSERAKTFFAFPSEPLTPDSWNARIHPEDFEGYCRAIVEHFKGRTSNLECEYRIRDSEGGYRWILDRGIGVRNDAGRVVRVVGAISDITTRKLAEMELRRARDAAETATRTKSNFLANMSHELRTPLNAIIGFTRIVMRKSGDTMDPKQYQNLEKILASSEHLLTLINSVLDLSKIEAERVDVEPKELELGSFLDRCLHTVEPLVDPARVTLSREVDPDLPTVFTDEERLRQIVINLLSNAVKFTETGRISVIGRKAGRSHVVIAVTDSGIGIPEDKLSTIFEEFAQVDGSSTRQHGGTGLGLAIGKQLARLLGGDIEVRSLEGEGSTFTLTFPVRYSPDRQPASSGPLSEAHR